MSTTSIEAHHQKWSDLPLFTTQRWVVTDEDIEAWNDLTYMRGILDTVMRSTPSPESIHDILGGSERDGRGLIEFDIDLYLEPWPVDQAAELLAEWRAAA